MQRRHFTSSPRSSLGGSPGRFAALLSRISQAILSPATALKLQHVGGPRGAPGPQARPAAAHLHPGPRRSPLPATAPGLRAERAARLSGASSRLCGAWSPRAGGRWAIPNLRLRSREGKREVRKETAPPGRPSRQLTGGGGSRGPANPSPTGGAGRVRRSARPSSAAPSTAAPRAAAQTLLPGLLRRPRGSGV